MRGQARSPRSTSHQDWRLLRALLAFLPASRALLVISGGFWLVDTSHPPAIVFTWHSPRMRVCVPISPFHNHVVTNGLTLTNDISREGPILSFWGLGFQHLNLGRHNSTDTIKNSKQDGSKAPLPRHLPTALVTGKGMWEGGDIQLKKAAKKFFFLPQVCIRIVSHPQINKSPRQADKPDSLFLMCSQTIREREVSMTRRGCERPW